MGMVQIRHASYNWINQANNNNNAVGIRTFNRPLKTKCNFKNALKTFLAVRKGTRSSSRHAFPSVSWPTSFLSPSTGRQPPHKTLYCSANSRGWCVWNGYKSKHSCTTPERWPRGLHHQSSHASYDKSQHGNFCKSIAEYTWMLSNAIRAKGQICKWRCPLGISSTKQCHFKPIFNTPPWESYNLQGMLVVFHSHITQITKAEYSQFESHVEIYAWVRPF